MEKKDLLQMNFKAALFDLDGVVVDTEPRYTTFWDDQGKEYLGKDNFSYNIKGQTLTHIISFFDPADHEEIVRRLNDLEATMPYPSVPGVEEYAMKLRAHGIPTAVVTSSNVAKMTALWNNRPDLRKCFDKVLTSEMFKASKPDPDCFLLGAKTFDAAPKDCVVFEDSFNGLKAARASGAYVVGLTTSNSAAELEPLSDALISDFRELL